jgi:hypothetical protein
MSDGKGSPSVNVEGMVEGFSGVIVWSPANSTFDVEDKTSRFGMVGCKWRVIRYATIAIFASLQRPGETAEYDYSDGKGDLISDSEGTW